MNLKSKIRSIEERIRKRGINVNHPEQLVRIAVGVWRCDENGNIIENSGPSMVVPKSRAGAYGILLVGKPRSREQLIKEAKEQQAKMMQRANEKIVESRKYLAAAAAGQPAPARPKPEALPQAPARKFTLDRA